MKKILCLGDLHCGSVFGLWNPNYKTRYQNVIKLNPLQEELFNKWELLKESIGKDYTHVFLLGDLIDGLNKNNYGKERMISDINEQVGCALSLLKPICNKKETIGITGSRYHNSADFEVDRKICDDLNGHFGGAIANVRLKNSNKVINIAHGGGFPPQYIGTRMSKEILLSLTSEHLNKIPIATILIRAHFHCYGHLEMLGKHFIYNPGWESARRNIHSAPNFFRFQPDIGAVLISIDEDEINVKPFLYQIEYERKNIKVI